MTYPSWVTLHGMARTVIELDKTVVHMVSLISFEVSSNVVLLKMWSRDFCFWDYGVEVFIDFPLFLLVSTTKHSGYFFVKKMLRVHKRKRRQTGIRSPRNGTMMSSLSFSFMYRPPTEDTGNLETQTATDQNKKSSPEKVWSWTREEQPGKTENF